jgi:hypothetical protein
MADDAVAEHVVAENDFTDDGQLWREFQQEFGYY